MSVTGPLATYPGLNSPGPSPTPSPTPVPSDKGLGGGAIAGIVIGAVCCVGISIFVMSKGQGS